MDYSKISFFLCYFLYTFGVIPMIIKLINSADINRWLKTICLILWYIIVIVPFVYRMKPFNSFLQSRVQPHIIAK